MIKVNNFIVIGDTKLWVSKEASYKKFTPYYPNSYKTGIQKLIEIKNSIVSPNNKYDYC